MFTLCKQIELLCRFIKKVKKTRKNNFSMIFNWQQIKTMTAALPMVSNKLFVLIESQISATFAPDNNSVSRLVAFLN